MRRWRRNKGRRERRRRGWRRRRPKQKVSRGRKGSCWHKKQEGGGGGNCVEAAEPPGFVRVCGFWRRVHPQRGRPVQLDGVHTSLVLKPAVP